MYATKQLSIFKAFPETALQPPPEGPSSGYLVRTDEGSDGRDSSWFWRLCKETRVRDLPFPQNRILIVRYSTQQGQNSSTSSEVVFFIPVLDKPLSSNLYYVVVGKGKDKGKIYTCSKEEDMSTCCFCQSINDVKPSPFDHRNIYQQMEIVPKRGEFTARSVAHDGLVPWPLRRKYWRVYAKRPDNYRLGEAHGLDIALRSRPLELDFPITIEDTPKSAVGKWYCPFFFVKETRSFKEQMSTAMFYEISLQQFWEKIYAKENFDGDHANVVEVNTSVQSKRVTVNGATAVEAPNVDGFAWFVGFISERQSVGLSLAVWNRMRQEQSREGWADVGEERVERVEEFAGGLNAWNRFGCYVFVERKIYTCSKEEDMSTCCFCQCIDDVKPSPFDHRNIYQQMEIVPKKGKFTAKSVAPNGFVPWLFRQKYWRVYATRPENYSLGEALGLDIALRSRPLKLDFPITIEDTPKSTVGKWYCPFFLVKETRSFKDQMSNAMFYEVSLQQFWEQIYAKENFDGGHANVVEANTSVQSKRVTANGEPAVEAADVDGFARFEDVVSRRESVGLSLAVWNRMRREQSGEGWADAGEERVERVEEFGGGLNAWNRFGCYVFVERYAFKRMDGSLAFTFDFVHSRKIRTKWE